MAEAPLRLNMRRISKSFAGVPVLRNVDFRLAPGEVVAILGSNGAGKSTLMKILGGIYRLDSGEIEIDGKPVSPASPTEAIAAGVRMLPQEISVMPEMTVAENISLPGIPTAGRPRRIDRRAMRETAAALLKRLGFPDIDPDGKVGALSAARQRIVEVCRALHGGAAILVMDEPTAALSSKEAETLFGIIRQLRAEGVSVVYISHYLSEVFAISDRIVVLRDGQNAGEFDPATATPATVLAPMLGQAVGDLFEGERGTPGEVLLDVEALAVPGRLSDVSFAVRSGEVVGAFGLVGSGLECLGGALFRGRPRLSGGRIAVAGEPYRPTAAEAAVRRGMGFVAGERKREGIVGGMTVRENLTLPFLGRFMSGIAISRRRETEYAAGWIRRLGIRTRGPEQALRTLSGGNQQKVCIARWLTEGIRVLILEEPTRGVDIGARRDIYRELRELARSGFAILLISSDVDEVAGISDRSFVLDKGRIAARFPAGTPASALMAAAGGALPQDGSPHDRARH
jgi:ribose transport system ATP-binding protein